MSDVAVLVGNGLSVAFNPELNLQSITAEVLRRIEDADGSDAVLAMKEIAERALPRGATSDDDFELLVGAFGAERSNLGSLRALAELTRPTDAALTDAIAMVADFADEVRDNGISHVLEVICERSHAFETETVQLCDLVTAIISRFDGRVSFGNLNYDTILLATLLNVCKPELADMGHGWRKVSVTVNDSHRISVPALRATAEDFPDNKRVRLLHLHGSLTYWATIRGGVHAKISKEILDDGDQWGAVRNRTTNVRPVVVLANQRQKVAHAAEYPFSLAYDMFATALADADHWLVVGYSFKDEPVNAMLREDFLARDPKPEVLVVTYGPLPTNQEVEQALGWGAEDGSSSGWLVINRNGANGVQETSEWTDFAG